MLFVSVMIDAACSNSDYYRKAKLRMARVLSLVGESQRRKRVKMAHQPRNFTWFNHTFASHSPVPVEILLQESPKEQW